MELSKQVVSFASSKRLKELGVPQKSLFYWETDNHPYGNTFVEDIGTKRLILGKEKRVGCNHYSAYTVAELGEFLPNILPAEKLTGFLIMRKIEQKDGSKEIHHIVNYETPAEIIIANAGDRKEVEARDRMLCYLIENGLLDAKKDVLREIPE